jgi:hypothetical protein
MVSFSLVIGKVSLLSLRVMRGYLGRITTLPVIKDSRVSLQRPPHCDPAAHLSPLTSTSTARGCSSMWVLARSLTAAVSPCLKQSAC